MQQTEAEAETTTGNMDDTLALNLLARLRCTNNGDLDNLARLVDPEDVYAYLENDYQLDTGKNDQSVLVDSFVGNLSNAVENYRTVKGEESIEDVVDLNILIEKNLLDYELLTNSNAKGINNGKTDLILDHESVTEQLQKLDDEDTVNTGLLRHYIELLKLGYCPDINLSNKNNYGSNSFGNGSMNESSLGDLTSLIISIAIERKIELPAFDSDYYSNKNDRIKWFKDCIYKIIDCNKNNNNNDRNLKEFTDKNRTDDSTEEGNDSIYLNGNKSFGENANDESTALKDLQFAHSYLTKKYEEEVSHHGKYINDMVYKYKKCESLLENSNNELEKVTNRLIKLEMEHKQMKTELDQRTQQVHSLMQNNNLLKVNALGMVPVSTLLSPSSSSAATTPLSPPETGGQGSTDSLVYPSSANSQSPSVRILRAEFLKIVEQMNSKFQQELEKVREARDSTTPEQQ